MAIAYVRENATFNNNGTAASFNVSVSAGATAGNRIFVIMRTSPESASGYSASFSDSKSNTWTVDFEYKENFQYLLIASTPQDAGALTTSDTITFTLNMARASNSPTLGFVEEFSGTAPSLHTDGAVGNNNETDTTQTTLGATPSASGVLVLALNDTQSTSVTQTINASGTVGTYSQFTTTNLSSSGVGNARRCYPVYQILSQGAGTEQKHAWSLSSGVYSDMSIGMVFAAGAASRPPRGVYGQEAINRAAYW